MTGSSAKMTRSRSRSSSSVRLVIDKPVTDKFATQYATVNHLNKYPVVLGFVDAVLSFTLVAKIVSMVSMVLYEFRVRVLDSSKTPSFVKQASNYFVAGIKKLDEVVNVLILREGIDAFLSEYHDKGKAGLWMGYFIVDYFANVMNHLIREVVLKRFSGSKEEKRVQSAGGSIDLPHVKELRTTTREAFEPTKEKVVARYDTLVKPAKETYTTAVSTAKETYSSAYKTISEKYDSKLKETDSVPRAILSTGTDLGTMTVEKLKQHGSTNGSSSSVDGHGPVGGLNELAT